MRGFSCLSGHTVDHWEHLEFVCKSDCSSCLMILISFWDPKFPRILPTASDMGSDGQERWQIWGPAFQVKMSLGEASLPASSLMGC